MSTFWCAVFILVAVTHLQVSTAWTGHVCARLEKFQQQERVCVNTFWGSCLQWNTIYKTKYRSVNYCCPGWTDANNNENCNIPICSPGCDNGGTCVLPQKCLCPAGYEGDLCAARTCTCP